MPKNLVHAGVDVNLPRLKPVKQPSLWQELRTSLRVEGLANWSVGRKIASGYLSAIAIALLGSLGGLIAADYWQGQGIEQLNDALTQLRLLTAFEVDIQEARSTIDLMANPALKPAEVRLWRDRLYQSRQELQQQLLEIEQFLAGSPVWHIGTREDMVYFLQEMLKSLDDYAQAEAEVESEAEAAETADHAEILALQKLMQLDRQLQGKLVEAQGQAERAQEEMEAAQGLEKALIIGSLLVSAAIAAWVALLTTRAIAGPLVRAAEVARRAAEAGDYSQRIGLTGSDEVGAMARALDALMNRVSERTGQLEQALAQADQQRAELRSTLAALQLAQAQLVQSEKLSSLGSLAAGVAHEINNPVGFIHANLDHLSEYVGQLLALVLLYEAGRTARDPEVCALREAIDFDFLEDDLPKLLASMRQGTERIRAIVRSLRTFARLDESEYKAIDLHESLESVLGLLNSRLSECGHRPAIRLVRDYDALPRVECYAGLLNQTLMNLIANALDALDDTHNVHPDRPLELRLATRLLGDGWLRLSISDTALGMTAERVEQIFDPFFTTKPTGRGTGMGLAIAHQTIVKQHGGRIVCHSSPGQGTTFTIDLPSKIEARLQQHAQAAVAAASQPRPPTR